MENENISIESCKTLPPFFEEHRYGVLLGWRIRKGLEKEIPVKRIKKYTDWFFVNYIKPLLEDEEQYVFPILGKKHKLIRKALSNHRRLKRLFNDKENIERALNQIEEELEQHIRFEERELFALIQEMVPPEELKRIEESHKPIVFVENTEDVFWE